MQTTVEETDKHKVKLTIEVPPDEFGKDLDRAYRKVARQVKIPGFRKGKVPRQVIDAQIGRDAVLGEFLEESVPTYYRDAMREHDLAPIAQPDIDLQQVEEGKPLVFTATVEVRPRLRFEDADYKGIELDRPTTEVTDQDVDAMVDSLRERFAELEPVARPAHANDYVVMDIRASVHGQDVADATRQDYLYEVGSEEFGPKLDAELEGKRAGEILKVNDVLPQRFGDDAGREVSLQVLVKDVRAKKLPAADDEFAKTASEFDTLGELRAELAEQIAQSKDRAADGIIRDAALAALIERTRVDLPESLVDEETGHRVSHARERAERAGTTLDQLLASQGFDELRFRADARQHAERAIIADLVLEAVARAEDIQVTPDELAREITGLAAALGREPKEVAKTLESSGQIASLAGDIIRSKALDILVEHANIRLKEDGISSDASNEPSSESEQDKRETP
jgi:trigger factor